MGEKVVVLQSLEARGFYTQESLAWGNPVGTKMQVYLVHVALYTYGLLPATQRWLQRRWKVPVFRSEARGTWEMRAKIQQRGLERTGVMVFTKTHKIKGNTSQQ